MHLRPLKHPPSARKQAISLDVHSDSLDTKTVILDQLPLLLCPRSKSEGARPKLTRESNVRSSFFDILDDKVEVVEDNDQFQMREIEDNDQFQMREIEELLDCFGAEDSEDEAESTPSTHPPFSVVRKESSKQQSSLILRRRSSTSHHPPIRRRRSSPTVLGQHKTPYKGS